MPDKPPQGRIALVFTDVEGSAALWESDPDGMRLSLSLHDALLRQKSDELQGFESRAIGDAFLFAFPSAVEAVRWCMEVQRELMVLDWPESILEQPAASVVKGTSGLLMRGLRVRMGLHVGEPGTRVEPGSGKSSYTGPVVRRTGRLAGAAHGGQVLITEQAWREAQPTVEEEVVAIDLGAHQFRRLSGTVGLIQVLPTALEGRSFPPIRTVDVEKTNLVNDTNAMVGRDDDLAALAELFEFGVRMVTVVGATGIGKSRLCREFAARNLGQWAGENGGGVWICDLGTTHTLDGLLHSVASALNVPLNHGRSRSDNLEQLGHAMAARGPTLLVLNGFGGLGEAGREALYGWMRQAPDLRFLITGKKRLRLEREVTYELGPLALPEQGHPADSPAVRLLTRRMRERGESVRLDMRQQRMCLGLLRDAGGVPLAVEMLAGLVGPVPIAVLEADIAGRLREAGEAATVEQRLRAVFDTCFARLRPWERGALARCTVFRDGFDLRAAEAVLDLNEWAGAPWVVDALERLKELGMLRAVEISASPGNYRYHLHSFFAEAAAESFPPHDKAAVEQRHSEYYLHWARPWTEQVHRPAGAEALSRLDLERPNLSAVAENSLDAHPLTAPRLDAALRAARLLDPLFSARGPLDTLFELLDTLLEAAERVEGVDTSLVLRTLRNRAAALQQRERWSDSQADLERALAIARETEDALGEASCLGSIGQLLQRMGRYDDALPVLEESLQLLRAVGDQREEGIVLGDLGVVSLQQGDNDAAEQSFRKAVELFRIVGDRRNEGAQVGNLGVVERRRGNVDKTQVLYTRALDIHREIGDRRREGVMLSNLGVLQYHLGNLDAAMELYAQSMEVAREVGNRTGEATALGNLGLVDLEWGAYEAAERNFAQALALNRDASEVIGEGCDAGYLGVLLQHQHQLDRAQDHYRRALEILDGVGSTRESGIYMAWAGSCEAERGDIVAAKTLFIQASQRLEKVGDPGLRASVEVLKLSLDIVEADPLTDEIRSDLTARAEAVVTETTGGAALVSGDLRLAVNWLKKRLADQES